MQKRKQQLFALALALWAFSSCSQDARDTEGSATGGETVTFSLDAEISVDDSDLRGIDYKLGKNVKNQLVPLPQFVDKQEVEVHTILKSSNGPAVAKTLKWRYDAKKRKLVLKQTDGHSITVSGFNNDSGVKWYISGLIGGTLIDGTTRVTFSGERVLRGVNGNEGDIVGSLNVPYSFGWTELKINTKSTKEANNSYKYAEVPAGVSVKFVPRGSLIAYQLGNAQIAGTYSFTPTGFTAGSNSWGDQGEFELNSEIPESNPSAGMPVWTEDVCGATMYYTFASGHSPSTIAHNRVSPKTYYTWVIPHKTQPTSADVRVMLKGSSSRPETSNYKDYTKTYFTDYAPKSSGSHGKVSEGRVHRLTARAIRRVVLPIEYVSEYNLAGGEDLTYVPSDTSIPLPGTSGSLRFSGSHDNNQSGYYNWYKVSGNYDASLNPKSLGLSTSMLLDVDGSRVRLGDRYFIPDIEHWWSIFPGAGKWDYIFFNQNEVLRSESMAVGWGNSLLRQTYLTEYSKTFSSPIGGSNAANDALFYALRFKTHDFCSSLKYEEAYDYVTSTRYSQSYPAALDNSFKCAYRFTRVGGKLAWEKPWSQGSDNRLVIDVVYLGEEDTPTALSTISDERWWAARKAEGKVFSRVFPASGSGSHTAGRLSLRDWHTGYYWSNSASGRGSATSIYFTSGEVEGTDLDSPHSESMSVRPFIRIPQ